MWYFCHAICLWFWQPGTVMPPVKKTWCHLSSVFPWAKAKENTPIVQGSSANYVENSRPFYMINGTNVHRLSHIHTCHGAASVNQCRKCATCEGVRHGGHATMIIMVGPVNDTWKLSYSPYPDLKYYLRLTKWIVAARPERAWSLNSILRMWHHRVVVGIRKRRSPWVVVGPHIRQVYSHKVLLSVPRVNKC